MRLDHRLAAAGLMAALFVSGGLAGGFFTKAFLDGRPAAETRRDGDARPDRDRERGRRGGNRGGPPGDPRALMSSRAVDQLARRLELSDTQRDSVEAVLERGRQRASGLFAEVGPRLRAVLDTTNVQIRSLLDPPQQAEFDSILQEDRGILGRRFLPPDSGGGR